MNRRKQIFGCHGIEIPATRWFTHYTKVHVKNRLHWHYPTNCQRKMSTITDLQLSRFCISLQSEERARRKSALEELNTNLFGSTNKWSDNDLSHVWEIVNKPLSRSLTDSAESCRNLSVELWKNFLNALPILEKNIVYLIPILSRRLSFQELIETSEEVRLNYISLLRLVVAKYTKFLSTYCDDVVAILARTVTDNYPEIKRESCQCIEEIAIAVPAQFYSRSESLVKPIISNFTHQHYKVRVASVRAIGKLMQHGNSKSMDEVSTPLAERLFDQSGAVRLAVVEVAGQWLLELRDRYSWWHKLIPLLVTGLHDEIENIRNRASELWDEAGKLYIRENENDEKFKDKMDFLIEDPVHYPPNVKRPNLGCRVIVQQNLCKLVGGIGRELGDWLADIRVRSAQLLCVLVLNAEQDVTQHIEKLLPAMYRSCNDEDSRVVTNVELAAEYMGYFVPPSVYCRHILATLEDTITPGHLKVFAAVLRGSEATSLQPKLPEIGNFFRQSNVARSKKPRYQEQLLRLCESLIIVCKEDCSVISEELFTVLFTLLSMCQEEDNRAVAKHLLEELVRIDKLSGLEELFDVHLRSILMDLKNSSEGWTIYSAEVQIFRVCISHAVNVTSRNLDLVLPIFRNTMKNESEPELRLKLFILLSDYFNRRNETLSDCENYVVETREFVDAILREVIVAGLVWSAGRAAEAIRTAAVCCLCAILDDRNGLNENDENSKNITLEDENDEDEVENPKIDEVSNSDSVCKKRRNIELFASPEDFSGLFEMVVPLLVSLVDDNSKKTRMYALKAICLVIEIGRKFSCVTEENIHATYPTVLKRLDDGCDDVRCAAIEALVVVWRALPKEYDLVFSRSHVDCLYTTAIIHLDDPDAKFQLQILDALMELGKVHPELLAKKIENCKANFRNQAGLDKLLDHCHELLRKKK